MASRGCGGSRLRSLYRVNFEVTGLKPFSHLAFPRFSAVQNSPKQPSFDGELMASFLARPARIGSQLVLWRCYNSNRAVFGRSPHHANAASFIGQRTGMSVEPSVLSGQQRAQRDLHTRFGSRSGRAHG